MLFPNSLRALVAIALCALFAGCNAARSTVPATITYGTSERAAPPAVASNKGAVLLATDYGTGDAYFFDYRTGKLLNTISDLETVEGVCSDGAGHFWVTAGLLGVYAYSDSGQSLGTLEDHGSPVGCAYDPKTGNLAVVNIIDSAVGSGFVAIFPKAQGTPQVYSDSAMPRPYFAAYVGRTGTLVVDGEGSTSHSDFALASFKNGAFHNIDVKGASIGVPGGVSWSSKLHTITVGDQEAPVIYQVALSGKVTGKTTLQCSPQCNDIVEDALFGDDLIVLQPNGIDTFEYPRGGAPKHTSPFSFREPVGVALSNEITE
jgi:hypothetical protein